MSNVLGLDGPHLSEIELEDGSPCVQILSPADDALGLGPQQVRIYGEANLLALARFCITIVRSAESGPAPVLSEGDDAFAGL